MAERPVDNNIPKTGGIPNNNPKAAPAKPISDKVWAKKLNCLATTKTPTKPATKAIKVLVKKAVCI